MSRLDSVRTLLRASRRSAGVVLRDIGNGALELGHNGLALVGLTVVLALVFFTSRPELRERTEAAMLDWLQERHGARAEDGADLLPALADTTAVSRATAVHPGELTRPQAAVAQWISRRYGVAQEPVGRLVQEAWTIGQRVGLDPTLILAVVAIESRFNPFAQSPMGAQGLMQVMTRVHGDKYEPFGGTHAAFDPVSNLRVGVQVLRECIARAGGLEEGLTWYVGAGISGNDGGYKDKVLAEKQRLQLVAAGKAVPTRTPVAAQPQQPQQPQQVRPQPATEAAVEASTPAAPADEQIALAR
jgi:soluble lytic murein transglycosylase-like protein